MNGFWAFVFLANGFLHAVFACLEPWGEVKGVRAMLAVFFLLHGLGYLGKACGFRIPK